LVENKEKMDYHVPYPPPDFHIIEDPNFFEKKKERKK